MKCFILVEGILSETAQSTLLKSLLEVSGYIQIVSRQLHRAKLKGRSNTFQNTLHDCFQQEKKEMTHRKDMRLVPEHMLYTQCHFFEENSFSLSQQVSTANSFLTGVGLCKVCVCCPSLWEFTCASALWCLEDAVSVESSTTSGSYRFSTYSSP